MTSGAESLLTMPEKITALVLLLAVAAAALSTLYRRVSVVLAGSSAQTAGGGGAWQRFLLYVPGQLSNIRNISGNDLAGLQHLLLFWGAICFAGYYGIFVFLGDGFGLSALLRHNEAARVFLAVTEVFGVLLLVALVWGLVRRTVLKPARLGPHFEEGMFLGITLAASLLLLCFYGLEGLRFQLGVTAYGGPLSGLVAPLLPQGGYHLLWWLQFAIIACFMLYVPYSDHQHAIFAPFNILAAEPKPHGEFSAPVLKESYQGLAAPADFSRKQLLEVYGCTQCGRCQDACPAAKAGKALSPKKMIQHLRLSIDEAGKIRPFWKGAAGPARTPSERVTDEELWSCTTCMACVDACPAFVSAVDKVVDLRRERVLSQSSFFPEVATLFRDLEQYGDVFGKGRARREDWAVGSPVRVVEQGAQTDTLFWVGCQASFHDRSRNMAVSMAEVMAKAGVDTAIMGKDEICCGDPMRRLGNEYQYQSFVRKNIESLKKRNFKRIVTYCPHCYNTLKNEYPQFGGNFEVVHYTELLQDLIASGKLQMKKPLPAKVVYHDPCYLARGNGLTKGREVLDALPVSRTLEVERCGSSTFCCGGGGGTMWMRETGGEKINELRVKELVKDGPEVIATSCPYCVMMLESGVNALGLEKVKCMDLIEMVKESV